MYNRRQIKEGNKDRERKREFSSREKISQLVCTLHIIRWNVHSAERGRLFEKKDKESPGNLKNKRINVCNRIMQYPG